MQTRQKDTVVFAMFDNLSICNSAHYLQCILMPDIWRDKAQIPRSADDLIVIWNGNKIKTNPIISSQTDKKRLSCASRAHKGGKNNQLFP